MGFIRNKRIKYAFKLGRIEHKAGRLLGWYLFICSIVAYFLLDKSACYFFIGGFIIWCVYILSHIFEKKCFGSHGPRSGWK